MASETHPAHLSQRAEQVARGLHLEYATIAYNSLEAVIAILAGFLAGSIALMGFGIDSVIEVSSGLSLVWRLRSDVDLARREEAERISLRVVGICFVALTAYVAIDAIKSLRHFRAP